VVIKHVHEISTAFPSFVIQLVLVIHFTTIVHVLVLSPVAELGHKLPCAGSSMQHHSIRKPLVNQSIPTYEVCCDVPRSRTHLRQNEHRYLETRQHLSGVAQTHAHWLSNAELIHSHAC
jgi:hypothetical protein